MKKLFLTGIAALFLATGIAPTSAQATETLTLACEGTIGPIDHREPREPISMGIIVNFTSKTVHGFDTGGILLRSLKDEPVKIADATETEIYFESKSQWHNTSRILMGTIDRVTGDVSASSTSRRFQSSNSTICPDLDR